MTGWAAPIDHGRAVTLSPLIRRVTENNPGPFTGPGTNTHLVGDTALLILDPGEDRDDGHFDRIVEAVGETPVAGVLPSHGHPDHWPLAPRLAAHFQAPILFFGTHPGFRTDRSLADLDTLSAGSARLEVLHTPGHTMDHVALRMGPVLFPGDHVMGWSSSVIAPPDGDLRLYLRSLERLIALPGLEVLLPCHGTAVTAPYDRMRELHAHRELRTRQALAALALGEAPIMTLVRRIYTDVSPSLHPAAAQSLLAHLILLEQEGQVEQAPGQGAEPQWRLTAMQGSSSD